MPFFAGTEFGETDVETISSIICRTLHMMESYLSDAEKGVLTKKCLPTSSEIKAFKDSKLKLLEYLWTVKEVNTKGPNEANFRKCLYYIAWAFFTLLITIFIVT